MSGNLSTSSQTQVISSVDLSAPRYRPKMCGTLNQDFLKLLRKQVPGSSALSDAQVKYLLKQVNARLGEVLIENRDGVEIPGMIGHLFIGSCPPKQQNCDFYRSQQLGYRVDYQNWKTDGFQSKIFFTTQSNRYRYKHHELWRFKACRAITRSLSEIYPEVWKKYVEVLPTRKISQQLHKHKAAQYVRKTDEINLQSYNEFEL